MAESRYVVFEGERRIAEGTLGEAAAAARRADASAGAVLVFDRTSGQVVDLDPRGEPPEAPPEAPRRGRPKLGVQAREVTLLPRHWDWLARQPGGASAALRRLVEAASKANPEGELRQARRDAAYRLMAALGGDLPGFEEASRALFAGDRQRLAACVAAWPGDVGAEVLRLSDGA